MRVGYHYLCLDVLKDKNPRVLINVAQVLCDLVTMVPGAGLALVPYYRQILPVFGYYKDSNSKFNNRII